MKLGSSDYSKLIGNQLDISLASSLTIVDQMGGFNIDLTCKLLDKLNAQNYCKKIYTQYITSDFKHNYPMLDISFSAELQNDINLRHFVKYNVHPRNEFNNFICSFNGAPHTSRKMLVSALHKFGYFNSSVCSKNMQFSSDTLTGNISDFCLDNAAYYDKFFSFDEEFINTIYTFGHTRFDHANNIYNLEDKLTQSFLHIVSETLATSYVPFVTEKFLYSIVTRGLFLSYAQPGWHAHVSKYYGFKLYTKLFDYRFDSIQNPVERLIELLTMVSKYKTLSKDDWRDLYLMEQDTIEYNYDHYFSGGHLTKLQEYADK